MKITIMVLSAVVLEIIHWNLTSIALIYGVQVLVSCLFFNLSIQERLYYSNEQLHDLMDSCINLVIYISQLGTQIIGGESTFKSVQVSLNKEEAVIFLSTYRWKTECRQLRGLKSGKRVSCFVYSLFLSCVKCALSSFLLNP